MLDQIRAVAIAQVTVIGHGEDQHVRLFAHFDAAERGPGEQVAGGHRDEQWEAREANERCGHAGHLSPNAPGPARTPSA